jgi:sugar phosphate isomerase/epimerase
MRLGGPLFEDTSDPGKWVEALRHAGYSAAYCPVGADQPHDTIQAYKKEAEACHILIAEVGAWSNPNSSDKATRDKAIDHCQKQLALADEIGARCCVNITGSRGEPWDGPHRDNLTPETFDLAVETTRAIIDAVKPKQTYYTLETMPFMFPDSVDSYEKLVHAIDRDRCAVHLDPVNLVSSPQIYYKNGDLIRDFINRLGPLIKSCHAKDTILRSTFTLHIDEVRPGLGELDYATFLRELNHLDPDTPLMLEHLASAEDYKLAAEYIRSVAAKENLTFR